MNDFFSELAKQLATRWLGLLALPGALFVTAVWAGLQLGHRDALDLPRLADAAGNAAVELGRWPVAGQLLAGVAAVLAAALAGLVVQALVGPIQTMCLGPWPRVTRPAAVVLTGRRRRRWTALVTRRRILEDRHPRDQRSPDQQREIDGLAGRANAVALAAPGRPTWMGDRIHALTAVCADRYGLDLTFCWSRLWLVLPDAVRAEADAVQSRFAAAVVTMSWSVPYLLAGALWWPLLMVGAVVAVVGRSRARTQVNQLVELVEATVDVHGRSLAVALGVTAANTSGPLTPEEGRRITGIARKGR